MYCQWVLMLLSQVSRHENDWTLVSWKYKLFLSAWAWWWGWLWLWWCRWWWWWWWCQPCIPALRAGTEILLWYEKLPARRAQASQVLKEDNIMHSFSGTKYLQTLVWFTNHDDGPSICLFEPQLLVVYLGGHKILLSGFFPLKGGIAPYSARGKFQ